MYEDIFSRRLSQLRMNKKVSARDMSLSIGQSPGYINGLENGNGYPSFTVFYYICEYLGVTPAEFFDEGNPVPEELREILDDLKYLSQEQIEGIRAIVKGLKGKL